MAEYTRWKDYIQFVEDNPELTCEWVKLATKRFNDDLKKQDLRTYPYYFNEAKAIKVIKFFSWLQHYQGKFKGKHFYLEPWQQFVIASIFGWLRKDNDLRRFTNLYLEVARKNGKSELLAAIGLYLLVGDGEAGAEIYTVATKKDQARIIHEKSTRMVQISRTGLNLSGHVKVFKNNLNYVKTYSKYEPLGSDSNTLDGLNVHGWLVDEYHAHKTNELYNVGQSARGAREQPITAVITTAGLNKNVPCYTEQHEYTKDLLSGVIENENFFGVIYTLDEEDDWADEEKWIKANPNLDISVSRRDMQTQCKKAIDSPTEQNEFITKRLNIWTQAVTRWISDKAYELCNVPFDKSLLGGKICYGGMDLSTAQDITAFILCFPPQPGIDKYLMLSWFFVPEKNLYEKSKTDKVPYSLWKDQGHIITTPGATIDYSFVKKIILDAAKDYDLRQIAYDRYNATQLVLELIDEGLDCVEFSQSTSNISAPAKDYEKKILDQMIADGGGPVMPWMVSCTEVKTDASGAIKPVKPDRATSGKRIDGVVASIMALERATHAEKPEESLASDVFFL